MSNDGPIYPKFRIIRTDGGHLRGGKHYDCLYFTLDVTHDPYALPALLAYAEACKSTHPELSADIVEKVVQKQLTVFGEKKND